MFLGYPGGCAQGCPLTSGMGIGSLNWLLRTLTGALFGLASVWLIRCWKQGSPTAGNNWRRG